MTLYRGFFHDCPICGRKITALTVIVLEEKLREHVARCEVEKKKADEAELAKKNQGTLF